MSAVLEKIKSRGHWEFVVRPNEYLRDRVSDFAALYEIVRKCSVRIGGWDVPAVDPASQTIRDRDYVSQEVDWSQYVELWRLYQSGQFAHFAGISTDWWDQAHWGKIPDEWQSGQTLSVPEVLFRLTGFVEFSARLSLTAAGAEEMHLEATVTQLQGRALATDQSRFSPSSRVRTTQMSQFPWSLSLSRDELIAEPRELALNAASDLFKRFDWNPSTEILRKHQSAACGFE